MPSDKVAYTITEIVHLSGLGRSSIYKAIGEGRLIARKSGRRTMVLADDLFAWLHGLKRVCNKNQENGRG
jgi:excisionase family DNA binding protein